MLQHHFPSTTPLSRVKILAFAAAAVATTVYLRLAPATKNARHYTYPPFSSVLIIQPKAHRLIVEPSPSIPYPDRVLLQSTLLATLRSILRRPIPSYDVSLAEQQEHCPNLLAQTALDQIKDEFPGWATLTTEDLETARDTVVWSVADEIGLTLESANALAVSSTGWSQLFGDGRHGIVFTGGK